MTAVDQIDIATVSSRIRVVATPAGDCRVRLLVVRNASAADNGALRSSGHVQNFHSPTAREEPTAITNVQESSWWIDSRIFQLKSDGQFVGGDRLRTIRTQRGTCRQRLSKDSRRDLGFISNGPGNNQGRSLQVTPSIFAALVVSDRL